MRRHKGFTLVELLVVIAIIALLMAILMPALHRAREQGKRVVCLSDCKQLVLAWMMYAEDNDDKIVPGRTSTNCWVRYLDPDVHPKEDLIQAVKDELLYPYVPNIGLYKCPTGIRKEVVTYAIVDAMNGHDRITGVEANQIIKNMLKIRRPSERAVFIDEGKLTPTSWTVYYEREEWWDRPPVRHGNGTNFSFADGHSEYWKWKDSRTISLGKEEHNTFSQDYNLDLRKAQKAAWGKLGYTPTSP
jgi:prepilin-type N-terminal cleavage/methylation domain-containing protein/prepilin-type processing-associated H-X9-DG protein